MVTLINQFGYETEDDVPLMTPEELILMEGGVFSSSTTQMENVLKAVSNAVRGYCGWHVAPNTLCKWTGDAEGRLVRLPAARITDISKLVVNGQELEADDYQWDSSGLIRLRHPVRDSWGRHIYVEFNSGVNTSVVAGVVAQLATNALIAPAGVRSEQAGDVSISYNTTTKEGGSGGIRLLESDMAQLDPLRLIY